MKPVIAVLWILSIALAVGLTRLAGPDRTGSEPSPSFGSESSPSLDEAFAQFYPPRRPHFITSALPDFGPDDPPQLHPVPVGPRVGSGGEGGGGGWGGGCCGGGRVRR